MSIERTYSEHRRLTILRLLLRVAVNCSILSDQVNAHGVPSTRDQVRGEMRWLAEQGLITVEELGGGLLIGTITQAGHDVARGLSYRDGVKRPSPAERG